MATTMPKETTLISVRVVPAADLFPAKTNSRKHSAAQVDQIRASIEEFGFTKPILEDGFEVVAGHGARLAALAIYADGGTIRLPGGQELPAGTVPVISCKGWTEAQRRAYAITDNKIAENSEWDEDMLHLELVFLDGEGFDLGLTGFDEKALARALAAPGEGLTDPDETPEPEAVAVSQTGDVWLLGAYWQCEDCGREYDFEQGKKMGGHCKCAKGK